MTREKRKFTPEDRLSIIQEASREGTMQTCRTHNLSPSLLQRWRLKYLANGKDGLKPAYHRVDPALQALEEENSQLKKLLGKMALEIEVKSELLKKTSIQPIRKKKS